MFFWLSKIGWALVSPDSILLLLLLFCCILLWFRAYKKARYLLTIITVCVLLLGFIPVAEWLRYPLETRFPASPDLPVQVDGIIMLSGPERADLSDAWQQVQLRDGAERYMAFMQLARDYPQATLLFSGGSGKLTNQRYKAADYASQLFAEQGLNSHGIVYERESRNTYENARLSFNLVQPQRSETWILVTSASHMPRAVGIFCKLKWPVIPYPVDHRTTPELGITIEWDFSDHLRDLVLISREWLGLFAYYLTDKTDAFLSRGC